MVMAVTHKEDRVARCYTGAASRLRLACEDADFRLATTIVFDTLQRNGVSARRRLKRSALFNFKTLAHLVTPDSALRLH